MLVMVMLMLMLMAVLMMIVGEIKKLIIGDALT